MVIVVLIGFSIRHDMLGVTNIIRATGIDEKYYDNLLDFFHSKAVKTDVLTSVWTQLAFKIFSPMLVNGRYVLCAGGIKIVKEGKKMPGVKRLHQESESNKKVEYIMGHSCQAIGLVVLAAYHNYIQVGIIAQGLLQYLSATSPKLVWSSFGSWLRTIRPGICPSEMVTATAMRNTFSIFLVSCHDYPGFTKFFAEHLDFSRAESIKLAG